MFATPRLIKIFFNINIHFLLSEIHKTFKYYIRITQQNHNDTNNLCFTNRITYTFKTLSITFSLVFSG